MDDPWGYRLVHAGKYGAVVAATAAALALGPGYGTAHADASEGESTAQEGAAAPTAGQAGKQTEPAAKPRKLRGHAAAQGKSADQPGGDESAAVAAGESPMRVGSGRRGGTRDRARSAEPTGKPVRPAHATSSDGGDSPTSAGVASVPPPTPASATTTGAESPTSPAGVKIHPTPIAESVTSRHTAAVEITAAESNPSVDTGPADKPGEPPFVSALLAWARRSFFNKSPSLHYDPSTTVQGQYGVLTGSVGAVDPEGDPIRYTLVKGPQHGTVVIDQATGSFTYTPDLDYAQAGGDDAFVVKVTDNVWSVRDLFRWDHGSRKAVIGLSVDSILPSAQRFIVPLPDNILQPQNAVFTADGQALVFRATPEGGTRSEIYRVNLDGTGLQCLTAGLAPELTTNLSKPFVFDDGNRVLLSAGTQSDSGGETADHYILECAGGVSSCGAGSSLLQINVPTAVAPGVTVIQKERELRVAPDGIHVGFTQLLGAGPATQLVSSVGTLQRSETGYDVVDARVVYVGGELKNFTPDGKGVMVTDFSGKYEAGNADDVLVDLRSGQVSRLTGNLDYDESVDMSPNGEWLAVGSSRTRDYLTPMSQILRPTFVPAYVVFPTFQAKKGTLNQAWVVSRDDELAGENGVFLGDSTGAYISVPVANWSPDGDSIAFWERSATDPTDTHLVVAQLHNIDGGTMPPDVTTPDTSSWAPALATVVPKQTPLEPPRAGKVGGRADVVITKNGNITTTVVTYTDFEDESGMILNGSETTTNNPTYTNITYSANITVTGSDGTERGYLKAENVKIVNQLSMTGTVESSLNGNHLTMGTPV
ncbi:Ig-like domain-containing protein [Mycolicibacterium cosmeticum]|uniref:Ig-like domain-containing protein n=1 Tax=Mycolicibacterium cosmeticum TaxID=258533 RepID=UPI003204F07C